jgi:hypothetical protein
LEVQKSEGKFLGRIAFWITEIVVILGVIALIFSTFSEHKINISFGEIAMLQGTILTLTWGAKASKNYIDMKKGIQK